MALSEGLSELDWILALWAETLNAHFSIKDFSDGVYQQHASVHLGQNISSDIQTTLNNVTCVTDCKSVYDVINKDTVPHDKRTAIELHIIKDVMRLRNHCLRWIDTKYMLVDCLTKNKHDAHFLRQCLAAGTYGITSEAEGLAIRIKTGRNRTANKATDLAIQSVLFARYRK